jgi:hypothetical protein
MKLSKNIGHVNLFNMHKCIVAVLTPYGVEDTSNPTIRR